MGVGEQNGANHKVFLLPRGDALVHDLNLTAQERAQNNRVRVNKSSPAISNVVDLDGVFTRALSQPGSKHFGGEGGGRIALRIVAPPLLSDPESSIIV